MKLTKTKLKHIIKEEIDRFTGGQIDVEPMSPEAHTEHEEAYYELFNLLLKSSLPGEKPSEKLLSALSWIARFEMAKETDVTASEEI
tara:strand:- start:15 stop:275 length:261 start_codon:yes stop_codon:yes gene_type:complete